MNLQYFPHYDSKFLKRRRNNKNLLSEWLFLYNATGKYPETIIIHKNGVPKVNKLNPFCLGSPVPPGVFSGRTLELEQINRSIFQTSLGSPQNLLITGERGIGKTSVAHITKSFAEKSVQWGETDERNPVLATYIAVQKDVPSALVLTQVVRELNEVVSKTTKAKNILDDFLNRFNGLSIAGSGITLQDKKINPIEIYIEAERSLRNLCQNLSKKEPNLFGEEPSSICIIIDELDQMGDFDAFSSFWKTLQEKLAADNCRNLMLVLVGMPELKERLVNDHESFLRTFTPLTLDKMPDEEAKRLINRMLEKGIPKMEIEEEAIDKILFYSENYPYLIQELGYSAFEVTQDTKITPEDVEKGINGTQMFDGSIKRLGELFFTKMYQEIIKSANYTEALKLIAKLSGIEHKWVSRQNLVKSYSKKSTSLDANLQKLYQKKLIIKNHEKFGEYRLFSKMFQVYVEKLYLKK